jgi:caffeoyl-CoA O-methyltransferase
VRKILRVSEYQVGIVNDRVEQYLASLAPKSDAILLELEADAEKRSVPIVGPLVGKVISLFLKSMSAQKALEVGTATGYSGIWITRSLNGERKKLTTIELDLQMRKDAEANFRKAGLSKYVEILAGNAREIVPELAMKNRGAFDVVFLDVGDKTLYVDLLESCIMALRTGGFLFADNTLWGGAVAVSGDKSPETVTIRRFNELVYSDKRLEAAIIPLRDGLTVAYKKNQ